MWLVGINLTVFSDFARNIYKYITYYIDIAL